MDAKIVSKELRLKVRPILKEFGFTKFSDRKAWKYFNDHTAVIDFPSVGAYNAEIIGCTSSSFSCGLGVYYNCFSKYPWTWQNSVLEKPKIGECQARRTIEKSLFQAELTRKDIWMIQEDNLSEVIADLISGINLQLIPWLQTMSDFSSAIKHFESTEDYFQEKGILIENYGGNLNSLSRAEIASALSLELKDITTALKVWEKTRQNNFYQKHPDILKKIDSYITWINK